MCGIPERKAAGWKLPRRPDCLGKIRIVHGNTLGQRRELLLDALHPSLVFLELFFLLHVTAQQADLLDELGEDGCDLGGNFLAHGSTLRPRG